MTQLVEDGLLSPEEEKRLAATIEAGVLAGAARAGELASAATVHELAQLQREGERAWRRFVAANLGLVRLVTGREAWRCALPYAELFQEGCLGLMTAVQKFDHRRGCRFSTYALPWIRAAVSAASSRRCGEVNLPVWRAEVLRRARGAEGELSIRLGRRPTAAEVGRVLGRDAAWVADLLAHRAPGSLEQCCEAGLQVEDPDLEAAVEEVVGVDEPELERRLAALPRLEREVILWRFGFVDGRRHSRADIARRLGIGATRCRTVEQDALARLRRLITDDAPATPTPGRTRAA